MVDQAAVRSFEEVLSQVETEIGTRTFGIWFHDIVLQSFHRGVMTVGVPNLFFRDLIDERYGKTIERAAESVLGTRFRLEVRVDPELYRKHRDRVDAEEVDIALDAAPEAESQSDFEGFVATAENEFALRALRHFARRESTNFNPIFAAGPSGVGKTHLLKAFRREARAQENSKVLLTDALQFTSQFTMALKMKTVEQFRAFYEPFQVIIVDELHRFRGKKATQVEFIARLKEWLSRGVQVVLASRHQPADILDVSDAFASVLHSGLVVEIGAYSEESLVKIMGRGMGPDRRPVDLEVLRRVAKDCEGNLGRLRSQIIRMHAFASLLREEVDLGFVDRHGAELATTRKGKARADLIEAVAEHFGVSVDALLSKRKVKSLRLPRGVAVCAFRDGHRLTFKEIGRLLGGRSHTSIHLIHGRYRNLIAEDSELKKLVDRLSDGDLRLS